MATPTRHEMIEKIYKEIGGHDEGTALVDIDVIRFGDIIQWLDGEGIKALDYEYDLSPAKEFVSLYLSWDDYSSTIDRQKDDCIKILYDLLPTPTP